MAGPSGPWLEGVSVAANGISFLAAMTLALWPAPVPAFGQTVDFLAPPPASYVTGPKVEWQLPYNVRQHTFLFGPDVRVYTGKRLSVGLWALGGVAKRFALLDPAAKPTDATPPLLHDPMKPTSFNGANVTALSLGGKVDYRVTDHLTYRILQPELLLVRFQNSTVRDSRISTGVNLTFGKP